MNPVMMTENNSALPYVRSKEEPQTAPIRKK
jgi:hypothetical protein